MTDLKEIYFHFLITSRNCIEFAEKCIDSIRCQALTFKRSITYIDDASDYSSTEKDKLLKIVSKAGGQVFFLPKRSFQIGSIHQGIEHIKDPNAVVCLIDGDDYLLPWATQRLLNAYSNPDIFMTYGNVLVDFTPYQDCQQNYFWDKKTVNTPYPEEVWRKRLFREDGFRCFHLRTFRRWLWDYIDPTDFKRPCGDYFHASGDSSFIYPMLEMLAFPKHIQFIPEPIYVYRLHSKNVHHHDKKSQRDDLECIRFSKKKYLPLDRRIIEKKRNISICAAS